MALRLSVGHFYSSTLERMQYALGPERAYKFMIVMPRMQGVTSSLSGLLPRLVFTASTFMRQCLSGMKGMVCLPFTVKTVIPPSPELLSYNAAHCLCWSPCRPICVTLLLAHIWSLPSAFAMSNKVFLFMINKHVKSGRLEVKENKQMKTCIALNETL